MDMFQILKSCFNKTFGWILINNLISSAIDKHFQWLTVVNTMFTEASEVQWVGILTICCIDSFGWTNWMKSKADLLRVLQKNRTDFWTAVIFIFPFLTSPNLVTSYSYRFLASFEEILWFEYGMDWHNYFLQQNIKNKKKQTEKHQFSHRSSDWFSNNSLEILKITHFWRWAISSSPLKS